MDGATPAAMKPIPFDSSALDRLMNEAGIDLLVATSKHNVQYLLGGHRFFFFDYMDAMGVSRYLPIFIYPKGKPENAAYIAHRNEIFEKQLGKFWPATVECRTFGTKDAMALAVEHIRQLGGPFKTVGVEASFLPLDAYNVLNEALSGTRIVDAFYPLERLRSRKTPGELAQLREASERVAESMTAAFTKCSAGATKNRLVEILRQEEVSRGLNFEYCLITAGTSFNRAPSGQVVREGDIVSLDSGGNFHGYIGDLCRMGIMGDPDSELEDLLGFVENIQQQTRSLIKPGRRGGDLFVLAEQLLGASAHRTYTDFVAHGMGLVSHEAPRLTSTGSIPYPGVDQDRPLESGMVISIETTMRHPNRGFIKLEDTVAVTDVGYEGYGDAGRGWNRMGVSR